ncbi:MAG: ComEC/Rec2 family competence protein [Eubacterium sp.]|nr:ComEC/Rec2 family competence protein [Eubacterium sp.]
MKRVFAHIGFSFAVSMLLLNLINGIKQTLIITAGLAILFIASLAVKKYRQALAVPLCLGAAVFACIIFMFSYQNVANPQTALNNQSAECEFYITSLEQRSDDKYSYTIKTKSINLKGAPQNIKLKMNTKKPLNCESYQLIKGKLVFSKIGDSAFSSYGYWGKNIFLSSKLTHYKITNEHIKSPNKFILESRQRIIKALRAVPGDEGAIARALVIGDKSDISFKVYNNFRVAGCAHLMAVSGLHLTAISSFLILILKKLRIKDRASFIITIAAIIYYCAICGFSKSVTRAGIMMSVLMIGNLFSRHSDPLNSLGLACFIICINPFAVCDVGAVLSVLCVLSLCTAYKYLHPEIIKLRLFKKRRINKAAIYVIDSIALSFCILLYSICANYLFFGYVSLVSIISSIILTPLGSFATVFSLLTSFAIRLNIGIPFIIICRFINSIIISLAEIFSKISFLLISFENYFGFIAAFILIIFALCFIIDKRYLKTAAKISLVIFFAAIISMAVLNRSNSYIYIASDGAAAFCSKGSAIVYGVETSNEYYSIRQYLTSRQDKVEYICAGAENKYSSKLAEDFNCPNLVFRDYKTSVSPDLNFHIKANSNQNSFKADIEGVSFSENSDRKDISVFKNICLDKNGCIDLNEGDIIYRIKGNKYSARRFSVWEE